MTFGVFPSSMLLSLAFPHLVQLYEMIDMYDMYDMYLYDCRAYIYICDRTLMDSLQVDPI